MSIYRKLCEKEPKVMDDLTYEINRAIRLGGDNSWVERIIEEAFDDLSENDIDDITIEADCYYSQLEEWFHNCWALDICEEARQAYHSESKSIMDQISLGQCYAKDRIYHMVNDFIQENKELCEESGEMQAM